MKFDENNRPTDPQKPDETWLDWLERVATRCSKFKHDTSVLLDAGETLEGIAETRKEMERLKEYEFMYKSCSK